MKKSILGAVALGAGGAAVLGFGAAAGRDLWRGTKKASGGILLLIAIAAAVTLPFIGARNLFRGHAPGEGWKSVGDILLVPAGIAIGIIVSGFAGTMLGEQPFYLVIFAIVTASLAAAGIGIFVGLMQRPTMQKRFAIAAANEAFLNQVGIRETGESEISHIDAEGNGLRLMERTNDSIVFMAVGKRNKRAYIAITPDGAMRSYSGVVSLGNSRNLGGVA